MTAGNGNTASQSARHWPGREGFLAINQEGRRKKFPAPLA
jgi:hypothetical protein